MASPQPVINQPAPRRTGVFTYIRQTIGKTLFPKYVPTRARPRYYRGVPYYFEGGVWMVEREAGHPYIVALDDSKIPGGRKFVESANTESYVRRYIDYLLREERRVR